MSDGHGGDGSSAPVYAKRYFDASPTWFAWNKLCAADIHALREVAGFEGQDIYFWLNHPIRFVRLVGNVCAIDSVGSGRYLLLTLDDSSGANVELKVEQRILNFDEEAEHPSNTLIDNLDVKIELGLPVVFVDKTRLGLGTTIRAEGVLTSYRNAKQILLRRVFRIKDTNEEALYWSKTAEWKRDVLSKPWTLTPEQRMKIDNTISREESEHRERTEAKRKWAAEHGAKMQKRLAKREEKRRCVEKKLNDGALEGSNVLHMPWD